MIEILDKSKCVGCHACYSSCPRRCLSMQEDNEGFLYPLVDKEQCINCKRCEAVCPVVIRPSLHMYDEVCFAAYSKDERIRRGSSSGGVFSVLAESVLKCGGVVFGAAFDSEFQVHHIQIASSEELEKLRCSKYVQSRIEDTYKEARNYLKSGRKVYFSGTPCQIDGLNNFLGREYNNLITQDIICHGVPAPFVWRKYLNQVKEKMQTGIRGVTFRDKTLGWRNLRDTCLRPSCYKCPSKGVKRSSDITLADFWNISDFIADFDDNKGVDLIVCHSEKGRDLLRTVSESVVYQEVSVRAATENIPMNNSPHLPKNRQEFIASLNTGSFSDSVDKYCSIPFSERVHTKIKHIIKKISRRK